MKKIVSVQDISCYGQCSLTVALPVLSAYGIETAILPSAILSTHTGGFTGFTVHDLTEEMPKIIKHWEQENIKFDAIYTGYIGDVRQFDMIKDMQKTLLKEGGQLIVDPAMADYGKLYVALNEDIVKGMRSITKAADIVLPNLTEAAFLLDIPYNDAPNETQVQDILKRLTDMGPETAVLTGVSYENGKIGAVAYNRTTNETTSYFATKISRNYHGTGDIFSSVVIANILNGKAMYDSLKDACEFVVKCINNTLGDDTHGYGVKFEEILSGR